MSGPTGVRGAFEAYELALVRGDVAALNGWFADDELTVRFGVEDEQWGAEQVRAWRGSAPPVPAGRTLHRTTITPFGVDAAVVNTLFRYPGRAQVGRQSQTWARLPDGWRIVAAHVSERPAR